MSVGPNGKYEYLNAMLSRWGQQVTGLPIDCQIQPQWEHQREAYGPGGAPRHHWRGRGARFVPNPQDDSGSRTVRGGA